MYDIKKVSLNEVEDGNNVTLNTNNIRSNGTLPKDYYDKDREVSTDKWINLLHLGKCKTMTIEKSDLDWMYRAHNFDRLRTGWLRTYRDEFDATCEKYRSTFENLLVGGRWFARTRQYSLKYSSYFQALSANDIDVLIKGLVSYVPGHSGIEADDQFNDKIIYFLPWLDLDPDLEFRIFVRNSRITAISQQKLFRVNNWLAGMSDLELNRLIEKILSSFYTEVQTKITSFSDYVLDFTFLRTGDGLEAYPIELNQFGQEYGAGSALYEWKVDHELLYGETDKIGFRFVDRQEE